MVGECSTYGGEEKWSGNVAHMGERRNGRGM